jgi:proteasome assembly chaperone (PAC2) family protein
MRQYAVKLSEYEGPGSFASMLLHEVKKHDMEMLSFVAEIPGYLQGANPLSIAAIAKRVGRMLNLPIDLAALREASDQWETEVTAAIAEDEELAETVRKLEEQYDNELISSE